MKIVVEFAIYRDNVIIQNYWLIQSGEIINGFVAFRNNLPPPVIFGSGID
jgi:Uma2 family endonuclease